jgi:serine/threonine-protein kinase
VVIPHSRLPIDADLFTPYEVIGEIGARPVQVYVARQSPIAVGGAQLVVAEHFPGACQPDAGGRSDLRREARRISTLANPHIARVREVTVRGDDLVVFGDFLDGEKLTQFWSPGEWLPLEIAVRVLLDVLTGLGALHGLRDSNQQPMRLTHGEISPATILFGSDGVARVLHTVARRAADASAEAASIPYLAPEVHTNDPHDGRADVFSVGVLLWEALEGKHLSQGAEPAGVRVRSAPLAAPTAPEKVPWAKALVPVAAKALAPAPEDRWPTAAAMAAEIRKAAGLKLAAASAAAAFAKSKFGDRVKQRRARWEARPSLRPGTMPMPSREPTLGGPISAGRFSAAADAPAARSEEFSSSLLESYRPPAPPQGPPAIPVASPASAAAKLEDPSVAQRDARSASPSVAPVSTEAVDELADVPVYGRFASNPPKEGSYSIPPLEATTASSMPEPPPSEAAVPFEAPVVFEEVAPLQSPFGETSPMPPALSSSGAPAVGARSRRRPLILGAAAALGIAVVSLVAVRAAQHGPPVVAAVQAAPPPAATAALPAATSASPQGLPSASPEAHPAAAAPPAASPTASSHPATTKSTPKTKPQAAATAHGKSVPVRPTTRSKPSSP